MVVAEDSLDTGMPWLPLDIFFGLPTKTTEDINHLKDSNKNNIDPLVCIHKCTACTSMSKIIKVYRNKLANDVGLHRYHLKKYRWIVSVIRVQRPKLQGKFLSLRRELPTQIS